MTGGDLSNTYPLTTGAEDLYRSLKAIWELATIGGLKFALHRPVMPNNAIHPDWEDLAKTLDLNLTSELERYEFVYTIGRSNAEKMFNCWLDSYKKCERENQKIKKLWRALRGGVRAIRRRAEQKNKLGNITISEIRNSDGSVTPENINPTKTMIDCSDCRYQHPANPRHLLGANPSRCYFNMYSGWTDGRFHGEGNCFMYVLGIYPDLLKDRICAYRKGLREKYQTNINSMRLCLNAQKILTKQLEHIDEDRPLFPRYRDRSYFGQKYVPGGIEGKDIVYYVSDDGIIFPTGLEGIVPPAFVRGRALVHPQRVYPDSIVQPNQSALPPGSVMPEGMIEVIFPSRLRGVSEVFDCTGAVIMTQNDFEYLLNHRGFARLWIMSRFIGGIPSHARTGADQFARALEAHANSFAEGSGQFASISAGTEGNGPVDILPVNVNEVLRSAPGAIIRDVPALQFARSNWIEDRFNRNTAPGNIIGVMDGSVRYVPDNPAPAVQSLRPTPEERIAYQNLLDNGQMTHEALMGMAENMGLLYEEESGTPGVIPVSDEELRRRITNQIHPDGSLPRNDGLDQVITQIINKFGNQIEIKIQQLDGITRAISPISQNGIRRAIFNMCKAGLVTVQSLRQQFEIQPYIVEDGVVYRSPYGRFDALNHSPVSRIMEIREIGGSTVYQEGRDWRLIKSTIWPKESSKPSISFEIEWIGRNRMVGGINENGGTEPLGGDKYFVSYVVGEEEPAKPKTRPRRKITIPARLKNGNQNPV